MNEIKLVIFDFDNTLYDGKRFALRLVLSDWRHALWAKAERKARKAIAGQDFGNSVALRNALFNHMANATKQTPRRMEQWYVASYLPHMVEILRQSYTARHNTVEIINNLREQNIKVAVLSDYPKVSERLISIGLGDLALPAWSTEELGALKPSAVPFAKVANMLGISAKETLVIGDRADTDAIGALAAGMKCVLLRGKKSSNTLGVSELDWTEICNLLIGKQ